MPLTIPPKLRQLPLQAALGLLLTGLLPGCSSLQPVSYHADALDPAMLGDATGNADANPPAAPPQEKLWPELKLNPDLVKWFVPSNDRVWSPDQAVMPKAEFLGNNVTVRNVRNITYRTVDDYDVHYDDRTYRLDKLTSVDFIVVPFPDMPGIAHTMLSFGFQDRDYLALSVEIRKEKGEKYDAASGFFNQYELMYVLADERDVIQKNANYWLCDVLLYRAKATPEQCRKLFIDVLMRANTLAEKPEFYNTLTNNCTTNIRDHINRCFPDRVPYDYRVLLPGYSDKLAYDLDLLKTDHSFEQARLLARVNYQAFLYRDDPDFSVKIRR